MNAEITPLSSNQITWLFRERFGRRVTVTETLVGGAWSSATAVTTDGGEFVLRCSASAEDFRRDALAEQFAGTTLPIPHVLGIDEYDHGWWCVSSLVPGRHLDDLSAQEIDNVIPSLARALIAMRDVDSTGSHGYGGWDKDGNGTRESFADWITDLGKDDPQARVGGWGAALDQHAAEYAVLNRGVSVIKELSHIFPTDRHLIHMDLLNRNVNVVGNEISGIYDWGCALWGDAVYELAWFAFWEPWYPQWRDVNLTQQLIDRVGIDGQNAEERLLACKLNIGLGSIQYNAFTGNIVELRNSAQATARLLDSIP